MDDNPKLAEIIAPTWCRVVPCFRCKKGMFFIAKNAPDKVEEWILCKECAKDNPTVKLDRVG